MQQYQYMPLNPQFNYMPPPMPQDDDRFIPQHDLVQQYGSIIKDLTATDDMLNEFHLRLIGKMKDENGKIVDDPAGTAYIKSERAAKEFVSLIRSMVNRHMDFSYFTEKEGYDIIDGAAKIIPEWLMYQSSDIPKQYRIKIGFEAMSYIKASIHKAMNGRMLTWTKGAINENTSYQNKPTEKKGIMDYIFPWRRKNAA